MAGTSNKVKFNLKNAHYALLTLGADGTPSYGNPVAMPGSVSLSLSANGEPENFYADGIAYYVINNNMGYTGDLELALIPESFRTDVLQETLDENGVLVEDVKSSKKRRIEADALVLSLGVKPAGDLARQLDRLSVRRIWRVGDAVKSGTIADACHSAFDTVMSIR